MEFIFATVFLLLLNLGNLQADEGVPIVNLLSGKVRGYISRSTNGQLYYGFRAIPYARSTTQSNRFKPPEPVQPWDGVFDGTQMGEQCPQFEELTMGVVGSEDCLNVNVYTPTLANDAKLAVMVWIHGGGFIIGAGLHPHYGPQNWMDHKIVLVTFNYRLGVLGSLNTQDEHAYGNYGMLDQVMVLKWVQDNIVRFGGDPNAVTIFGESAGSVSVTYHLLSKLSKGLFHRAIAQSGTALNYWAFNRNPLQVAQTLASRVQCPTNSSQEMVKCLKGTSLYYLIRESRRLQISMFCPLLWSPTVEAPNGPGFLTQDPMLLMEEDMIANRVPVIMGIMKSEGYLFYLDIKPTFNYLGQEYFTKEFPKYLEMFSFVQAHMSTAIQTIANEYYSTANLNDGKVFERVLTEIMGDAMFTAGVSKSVELLSKAGLPTYAYIIDHYGQHSLSEFYGVKPGKYGNYCTHGDELFMQFPFTFAQLDPMSETDSRMSAFLNTLWVSFADHKDELFLGDGGRWPVYDANQQYAELSLTPSIKQGLLSDKMDFWIEKLPDMAFQDIKDEL